VTGIAKGRSWGEPTGAAPDLTVTGDDAALARAVADRPGALVAFRPHGSDLARALGLAAAAEPRGLALPLDLIAVDDGPVAANLLVVGTPPASVRRFSRATALRVEVDGREVFAGPATAVVVANGQFLDGRDVVPRGHPGDGRLEIHVYALRPGERRAMRSRLPQGAHLPHPRIVTATGRRFAVHGVRAPLAWAADGRAEARRRTVAGAVRPGAYRILI
jgi:hypothetical protein